MKISVQAEIKIPMTPNFFRLTDGSCVPTEAVTDSGLKEIGRLWTNDLIKKAHKKRGIKP